MSLITTTNHAASADLASPVTGTAGNDTLDGGADADTLLGGLGNDLLAGGAGNDSLDGGDGDDTLDGGAGNDELIDGLGNDTYLFGRGDGQDRISHSSDPAGKLNTLQFKAGVLPGDIVLRADSTGDLFIRIADSGDQIVATWFLSQDSSDNFRNPLQQITFADGTTWDRAAIEARLFAGTEDGDFLSGTLADDKINGAGGVDYMFGKDGNDTLDGGDGGDLMYGGFGDDLLLGGAGDDHVVGNEGNDTLDGGAGNDSLTGMGGNDVILFGKGDGKDTVGRSFPRTGDEIDAVQFKAGLLPGDLALSSGTYGELFIKLKGSDDMLTVDSFMRDDSIDNVLNPVQEFRFADGAVWSAAAAAAVLFGGTDGNDIINGSVRGERITGLAGNDTLDGRGGNDLIEGGAGDDLIDGGTGSDLYLFGRGDGKDEIRGVKDSTMGKTDILQLKPGIIAADLALARSGNDISIAFKGSADAVLVRGFLNGDQADTVSSPLDQIRFDNGDAWYRDTILARLLTPTEGADTIIGFDSAHRMPGLGGNDLIDGKGGDDTLDGGAGNDTLDGGLGNDLYLFSRGDGQDTIVSYPNSAASEGDVLRMNVLPADVTISIASWSLVIKIRGGSDQVLVKDFMRTYSEPNPEHPLREIHFADNTVWTVADIMLQRLLGTDGDDSFSGDSKANLIGGRAGNDWLSGGDGNDTLDGGTGQDGIDGGLGNDTYLFGKGDGQDTVYPTNHAIGTNPPPDTADTLQFREGVRPDEVRVSAAGTALVVSISGSADQVRFEGYFSDGALSPNRPLHQIRFADGRTWDAAGIDAAIYRGSDGADILNGDNNANLISGLGGADQLSGNGGDDTLDGGSGNDTLNGGSGNDVYLFGRGDGSDSIPFSFDARANRLETLAFKDVILPEHVSIGASGEALIIKLGGGSDQVQVSSFLSDDNPANLLNPLQQIRFSDGRVWGVAEILARLFAGTSEADEINGTRGADAIRGGAGNDWLDGKAGDDTLDGGAGNDMLRGGLGNDTYVFTRGDGRDTLTTAFNELPGSINTLEFRLSVLPSDLKLSKMGESLVVTVLGSNDEIQVNNFLTGNDTGNPLNPLQQIRFADGATWNLAEITARMFAGTSGADITSGTVGADKIGGLAGNDKLDGQGGDDTIDGGAGNDTLTGGAGNDTYLFGKGDGADMISAAQGEAADRIDTLQLKAGVLPRDVSLYGAGPVLDIRLATGETIAVQNFFYQDNPANPSNPLQQIRFADGTSWDLKTIEARMFLGTNTNNTYRGTINDNTMTGLGGADTLDGKAGNDILDGGVGNDTLIGGLGDDKLTGGTGSDTYQFGKGDGHDLILSTVDSTAGKLDTLLFRTGVAGSELQLSAVGSTLSIKIAGSADQITAYDVLPQNNVPNAASPLQQIKFADGVIWDMARIQAELLADSTPAPTVAPLAAIAAPESVPGLVGIDTSAAPLAW